MLSNAVVNLVRHGWPASMLLVYDEVGAAHVLAAGLFEKHSVHMLLCHILKRALLGWCCMMARPALLGWVGGVL